MKNKNLELYIHIPFCIQKCSYCDFLSAPADEATKAEYVKKMLEEIEHKSEQYRGYEVSTVFFGGGTPSILKAGQIGAVLNALRTHFFIRQDAEITIECNPGTLSFEKLSIYRSAGINRISVGLQSTDDRELLKLGRIHTFSDFLKSYDFIRKAGFFNVNVDIMSALPHQTLASYEHTVKQVLSLKPEHISAYSLIIEENTPFYEKYEVDELLREKGKEPKELPSEETERRMYEMTKELLAEHGYERYEISNYAKAGFACKHNAGYWRRENYLGFGLGAASMIENVRFHNTSDLKGYLCGDFNPCERETLKKSAQMEEFMFLGLRLTAGVREADFYRAFAMTMESVYGDVLKKQQQEGLIRHEYGVVALTQRGLDVSNYAMSEYLL